jgi:DNA-binding MarR family transcriptional regulator
MPLRHSNPKDALEIGRRPGHLIWRAQQYGWRVFTSEAKDIDITPVQASILLIVGDQPGIDQKSLATMIALDKATTGSVVQRLEARKLLVRKTPPTDRRARAHFLTAKGRTLNRELGLVTRRSRERLVSELSQGERDDLVRLLRKMLRIED